MYGDIVCEWEKEEGLAGLEITLPAGTRGTLILPAEYVDVRDAEGVAYEGKAESNKIRYNLLSGSYSLKCRK
jgi:hypothetical protein